MLRSSVKPPPAAARLALAVALLGSAAGVVHRVVPKRKRQKENAHEKQQRNDLQEQREQHHGAAARLPEGEQLGGGTRYVQREQEEAHHTKQKDRGLLRLAVVELTQPGHRGQPCRRQHARRSAQPRLPLRLRESVALLPLPLWGRVVWGRRRDRNGMRLNHWRWCR